MSYQALLFCPDEKTARVVTQILTDLDFTVEPCNEPFAAVKKLMAQHFDAVVVDSDNEQNATLLFKSARNSSINNSSLAVAVVEGQAGVAKAFRIGANLVLTKPINVEQSKGTLRVARGLLRKGADAAKPNAIPMSPSASAPAKPFASSTQKPPSTTEISAPAASVLEVEKEPEPQPEPAEMALLESMPDATGQTSPSFSTAANKEFPWQPAANPLVEPMASAMRHAAEAAGQKKDSGFRATSKAAPSGVKPAESRPFGQEPAWGSSTAAAPAPAKEKPRPFAEPDLDVVAAAPAPGKTSPATTSFNEQPISAPSFSSLDDEGKEGSSGGSRKALPVAVAVVLLVAACGYFGWTKLHLASNAPATVSQTASPTQTATQAPNSVPAPAPPAVKAPATTTPATIPSSTAAEVPASTATEEVTSSTKPSASLAKAPAAHERENELASASTGKPASAAKTPEPVIVKTESPKPAVHKPPVEESVAPPELGAVSSETNSRAISGIVNSTPVSVPQQAPQTLRVSQGVSQGLLLKRVQPVYPPQAQQMRVQGSVLMQAAISKEGNISNVKVLSGDSILARAAVEAVRQWKYKPYYLNGEPVEIQTQITVNFKLP